MNIGVLSGKGGTGKTFVSVNLATIKNDSMYLDFDVEEPNGHLFFKPSNIIQEDVAVKKIKVDEKLCRGCKKCVNFCKFNALAYANKKVIILDNLCHSCGGCKIICPAQAISEYEVTIGRINKGHSEGLEVITGIMESGHPSGVEIVKRLGSNLNGKGKTAFLDCPPGASCLAMESIKISDYCLIVVEPSLFSAHNLEMICELVNLLKKPFGVIINKSKGKINPSLQYCIDNDIKIIGEIPYEKELAAMNSNGLIAVKENLHYRELFSRLLINIIKEAENEKATNS